MAAADAPAARRRLALVSFAERRVVGAEPRDLDDGNALLVVSAGIRTVRERTLRDRRTIRTRLGWVRCARARRFSRRRMGASGVRCAAVACGCIGRRNRHGDAARTAGRIAAERRLARRILARNALAAAPKRRRRMDWRSPYARSSNPTAGYSPPSRRSRCARAPLAWIAGIAAIGAWSIRDAILWPHAIVPPSSTSFGGSVFSTSIAAHGLAGARGTDPRAAAHVAVLADRARSPRRRLPSRCAAAARALGWCAFAAAVLFVALPFGYDNGDLQLATGASIRFAAPAIALGGLLHRRSRTARARALQRFCSCSPQSPARHSFVSIFANDSPTLSAVSPSPRSHSSIAAIPQLRDAVAGSSPHAVAAAIFASATHSAQRNALDYYNDALRVNGKKPQVYAWIARTAPPAIAGWAYRSE